MARRQAANPSYTCGQDFACSCGGYRLRNRGKLNRGKMIAAKRSQQTRLSSVAWPGVAKQLFRGCPKAARRVFLSYGAVPQLGRNWSAQGGLTPQT